MPLGRNRIEENLQVVVASQESQGIATKMRYSFTHRLISETLRL